MVDSNLIRLERMEKKIDELLKVCVRNEEHLRQINGTLTRHEKDILFNKRRINKVERRIGYYIGFVVGLGTIIALILKYCLLVI